MKDNDTCEQALKSVRSFRKNNLQVILLPPLFIIFVISFMLFILYKVTYNFIYKLKHYNERFLHTY